MNHKQHIVQLIESDELRMKALRAAKTLNLPDWLIAAGFVRNLIWSSTFGNTTEINDIDVIYYCTLDCSEERDKSFENLLYSLEPTLPWSVKNQARMHLRNGDAPYTSSRNAMAYWPEKQTAIGVSLDHNDKLVLQHCFDLSFQFNRQINHNPAKSVDVFNSRITNKNWLQVWPGLKATTERV